MLNLSFAQVALNLILHLSPEDWVGLGANARQENGMLCLDHLKTKTSLPVSEHFGVLVILVEGGSGELLSPPGNVALLQGFGEIERDVVLDQILVVTGNSEGPDLLLVETVIDNRVVGIGRVGVEGLSLGVVPDQLLIGVLGWDERGGSDDVLLLWCVHLLSLKVVVLIHLNIISVVQDCTVLFNILVHSHEWVVERSLWADSVDERVKSDADAGVDLKVLVLSVVSIIICLLSSAAESLGFSVLVDAPEVIDSLVNGLVLAVTSEERCNDSPECDVLDAQLEHC